MRVILKPAGEQLYAFYEYGTLLFAAHLSYEQLRLKREQYAFLIVPTTLLGQEDNKRVQAEGFPVFLKYFRVDYGISKPPVKMEKKPPFKFRPMDKRNVDYDDFLKKFKEHGVIWYNSSLNDEMQISEPRKPDPLPTSWYEKAEREELKAWHTKSCELAMDVENQQKDKKKNEALLKAALLQHPMTPEQCFERVKPVFGKSKQNLIFGMSDSDIDKQDEFIPELGVYRWQLIAEKHVKKVKEEELISPMAKKF